MSSSVCQGLQFADADAVAAQLVTELLGSETGSECEQAAVSASLLSGRSLETCPEFLGNETGSDVGGGGRDCRPAIRPERKKTSRSSSFPPPLTSMGGSTGVQVQSRREGGRLVVEAVVVPSGSGRSCGGESS